MTQEGTHYYGDGCDPPHIPPPPIAPCPLCRGTGMVIVAGPDENGQFDADDCLCQTDPDFNPDDYCEHGIPDGRDCNECEGW